MDGLDVDVLAVDGSAVSLFSFVSERNTNTESHTPAQHLHPLIGQDHLSGLALRLHLPRPHRSSLIHYLDTK